MKCIASIMLWAVLLTGCGHGVSSHYTTKADAEADQLFSHGWLPYFIPDSSRAIITKNDPKRHTSEGEFSFDPADAHAFVSLLIKLDDDYIPSDRRQVQIWRKGYDPYMFTHYNSRWIFYVDAASGHGVYWMYHVKMD